MPLFNTLRKNLPYFRILFMEESLLKCAQGPFITDVSNGACSEKTNICVWVVKQEVFQGNDKFRRRKTRRDLSSPKAYIVRSGF